ncbi:MAG TPA: SCP2 sterol-binding domain-containing protein [Solirubrobacteraceae bacterium]|jgi:putative sterol carrier protein|nr:SCP2 sterol-binding domain-containing protein [Solirubrobacteraceae bacterium]
MDSWFDPQRALDQLKKFAADAPAQIADGVGRMVREASPERLDQIMKSPARRAVLDGIFWQMPRQLDAKAAAHIQTTIRWNITGRSDEAVDTYLLEVDNGTARSNRGPEGPDPKLTITMDGVEFLRLISGNSDPMAAYFKGRIQLAGDIMVAAQLAQIFKMPSGGAGPSDESGPGENGFGNGDGELDDPPH